MDSRKLSLVTENPLTYGNSSTVCYLFWRLKNRSDREPLQSGKKRQEKVREDNLGKSQKKMCTPFNLSPGIHTQVQGSTKS